MITKKTQSRIDWHFSIISILTIYLLMQIGVSFASSLLDSPRLLFHPDFFRENPLSYFSLIFHLSLLIHIGMNVVFGRLYFILIDEFPEMIHWGVSYLIFITSWVLLVPILTELHFLLVPSNGIRRIGINTSMPFYLSGLDIFQVVKFYASLILIFVGFYGPHGEFTLIVDLPLIFIIPMIPFITFYYGFHSKKKKKKIPKQFCAQCGSTASLGEQFCSKCGNSFS